MFEHLKKITLQGGCFDTETDLELFSEHSLSILYGRNGSGKTTIAKGFRELKKPEPDEASELTVSSEAVISEEFKSAIHVFDEDFVSSQVRITEQGVKTIVMLGEQVELDNQIAAKKHELAEIMEHLRPQEELLKRYDNAGDVLSPQYHFDLIRNALRASGGWAETDSRIKGNKVMSKVTPDLISQLATMAEPAESLVQLEEQLQSEFSLYTTTTDALPIDWRVTLPPLPRDLEAVAELLARHIERPELSAREQRLLALTQTAVFSHDDTRRLIDEQMEFCPLCLRIMDDAARSHLAHDLSVLLNQQAADYAQALKAERQKFNRLDVTFPTFPHDLNLAEINAAKVALDNLNSALGAISRKLETRHQHIYEDTSALLTDAEKQTYATCLSAFYGALSALHQCVSQYNSSVTERNKLRERLLALNRQIARKRLSSQLQAYTRAVQDKATAQRAVNDLSAFKQKKEQEIKELQQQKERTDIALDYINHELSYVFYSDRKLKLVAGDGCYRLTVNGRNVLPRKISVGERNVLALCYFFAQLFSGKADHDKYASEYLIVIDDPVSSFDHGNRIGVISLLRHQCSAIRRGNTNSRILIMSHDLHSIFDLCKIKKEVCGLSAQKATEYLELSGKAVQKAKVRNEYRKLLEQVFSYAQGHTDEPSDTSIGNVMRRLLEAFSSFCYCRSFEEMLRMESLLDNIPEAQRPYYENFMSRLILNGESHEEESVYALNTITPFFTREEKIRTARSILRFLLYVNRPHLVAYLSDKVAEIEGWSDEGADELQETYRQQLI